MTTINEQELKKIQLSILEYVASFCEDHQIEYWLSCGTLLGAVRHGGYIPWDDDIDIGMTRANYQRFLGLFNQESKRYKLLDYRISKNYFLPYGKIGDTNTILYEPDEKGLKINVNINVFIYDFAPSCEKVINRIYKKCNWLRDLNLVKNYSFTSKTKLYKRISIYVLKLFLLFFPKKYFAKRMNKIASACSSKEAEYFCNFLSYSRIRCPISVVEPLSRIEFEKRMFSAPNNPDEWLKAFYGDCMKLPPVEKRVSHHAFVAFYKDDYGK